MSLQGLRLRGAAFLMAVSIFAALAASPPSARASNTNLDQLYPGNYQGTLALSVEHTFNKPVGTIKVNYYSLRAEEIMGSMRFSVNENGFVKNASVRITSFRYNAVASVVVEVPEGSQGEYHCTGSSSYGAGVGTVSGNGGKAGAPPLVPSNSFSTAPVKLQPGDPWGRVTPSGKCPPASNLNKTFTNAIQVDFDALAASPMEFTITWQGFNSLGGSCTLSSWEEVDRSVTCYWAAYLGKYKRLTAPGPS